MSEAYIVTSVLAAGPTHYSPTSRRKITTRSSPSAPATTPPTGGAGTVSERRREKEPWWDKHISVSQYEEVPEDSLCYTSNPNHFVNSLSRTSDQMPDLQNAANVIFNKQLNGSDSCNWYLLKKFGDNTSNFSTYKPSIHRASAIFNGARIEGII